MNREKAEAQAKLDHPHVYMKYMQALEKKPEDRTVLERSTVEAYLTLVAIIEFYIKEE